MLFFTGAKKSINTLNDVNWIPQFTLPNCQHPPAVGNQGGHIFPVANPGTCELGLPVLKIGLWKARDWATRIRMPMPKTSVYEDYRAVARQYQVRCAWQVAPVKTKPVSKAMHHRTDGKFRLHAPRSNLGHTPGSIGWT